MLAQSLRTRYESDPVFLSDVRDALMVNSMRTVLAVCVFLTVLIEPPTLSNDTGWRLPVFAGYVLHSIAVWLLSYSGKPLANSKLVHWLDVFWSALIVLCTGSGNSIFFLLFLFAVLASSFRWGFKEGGRITLISAGVYVVCGLVMQDGPALPRLWLRTAFLLAFGYMCAHWGESKVTSKRRLALLRDVTRLSNPRFGVAQTIASVLEKTRSFYNGSKCILVTEDKDYGSYLLRTANQGATEPGINAQSISGQAALSLIALPHDKIVRFKRSAWPALFGGQRAEAYDNTARKSSHHIRELGERVAELFETRYFISAPLSLRSGNGRIYVTSERNVFSKVDALFLGDIVAQAFPVIDNVALLDRMASDAAYQERKRLAWDLHDAVIQPYIGLNLGLNAVRRKASPMNPLNEDLDKLASMTTQVIDDLRRYAGTLKAGAVQIEPILLTALQRKTAQIKEFYGIDIAIKAEGEFNLNDRLIADVLQMVNEALSNICRHTTAQKGNVNLRCGSGLLRIDVENENDSPQPVEFRPKSIAERAAALGGKLQVKRGLNGGTVVHIEIPI